jgi:hypothetical protein
MEHEEVAVTAIVAVSSSEGDIGVVELSEGKLVCVQEKYSSKLTITGFLNFAHCPEL